MVAHRERPPLLFELLHVRRVVHAQQIHPATLRLLVDLQLAFIPTKSLCRAHCLPLTRTLCAPVRMMLLPAPWETPEITPEPALPITPWMTLSTWSTFSPLACTLCE